MKVCRNVVSRLGQPAALAFVRDFEMPQGEGRATLRLQSDDRYRTFLDGREVGQGAFEHPIDRHDVWELTGIRRG